MRPNELEFAARESGQHLALRPDDLPQVQHLLFDLQNLVERPAGRILKRLLFQFPDLQRQLLQRRLVILHDRIEQRVRHPVRRARYLHRALETALGGRLNAPQRHLMVRDQKVLSQEEIQLAGREHAVLATVINRMNHHEQIGRKSVLFLRRILLDFRRRAQHDAIFNRERMEVKNVFQDKLGFLGRRLLQINPEKQVRVRQKRRHQERFDVLAVQTSLSCKCERTDHGCHTCPTLPGVSSWHAG